EHRIDSALAGGLDALRPGNPLGNPSRGAVLVVLLHKELVADFLDPGLQLATSGAARLCLVEGSLDRGRDTLGIRALHDESLRLLALPGGGAHQNDLIKRRHDEGVLGRLVARDVPVVTNHLRRLVHAVELDVALTGARHPEVAGLELPPADAE